MAIFGFNHHWPGGKTHITGHVNKVFKDDGPYFVATSEMFPDYETVADTMVGAVDLFRDQLALWLENNPDQRSVLRDARVDC